MFRYTDLHGERRSKSTGTTNKTKAQKFIREFIDLMQTGTDTDVNLRSLITPYEKPETNPRAIDAKTTGRNYSPRYAKKIAREATSLIEVLEEIPGILDRPAFQLSRRNIKDIAPVVVDKYGKTTKAKSVYKLLKLILSQAADDGIIHTSPAMGLPDIRIEHKRTIFAFPPEDISLVINSRHVFPSEYARDIFIVLASTGLRRSELLALNKEQVKDHALVVDRAFKDDSCKIIGLPKWDKTRALALPKITEDALDRIFAVDEDITIGPRKLMQWIRAIGVHGSLIDGIKMPDAWQKITPHMLRHSLNTMLRIAGLPDVLVAEYMSWEHQVNAVQAGYTHIYSTNLRPVAKKIDELLEYHRDYKKTFSAV
jgi:integrase